MLHRDIKSGNVLLSGDYSQAKICDVGLAHIMGSTSNTGQSVQATFAYAAPEMLFNYKYGWFTVPGHAFFVFHFFPLHVLSC